MSADKNIYAIKALSQIPRLLGNMDRNVFSPTYGCCHRDYWLDKTSDFPDAVRQFSLHALALVYTYEFPDNPYQGHAKIRDWTIAGLQFWSTIQHSDGSFDEFYPYERGWCGPTAFTTYTCAEACRLLQDEMPSDVREQVINAVRKAAYFISVGESEKDDLANHHAMSCLAVWKAYELLGDETLKERFQDLFRTFCTYHFYDEGWSREYDGVDPGYLSATVSFLGKIYATNRDPEILKVLEQSVDFCSYFVYPNGFYAGSTGSRNTLHFYCHGFEALSQHIPKAAAIAEKMLQALGDGKLVPPDIMSDRYVVYRVPEYLLSYLDYTPRSATLPALPYEDIGLNTYFPRARIYVQSSENYYVISNLAKGGVTKIFDTNQHKLLFNHCGFLGVLKNNALVTTQWIDHSTECSAHESGWEVQGSFQTVPSGKMFTPLKNVIFRIVLLCIGWNSTLAHRLKGLIRRLIILGTQTVPIQYSRRLEMTDQEQITLDEEILLQKKCTLRSLLIGDEFFVRYVPQSRYFQAQELDAAGFTLDDDAIRELNEKKRLRIRWLVTREKAEMIDMHIG